MHCRRDSTPPVIPAQGIFQKLHDKECYGELLPELREERHTRAGRVPAVAGIQERSQMGIYTMKTH